MNIFYAPGILINNQFLSEEESIHCSKVLRLNSKDIITLIDGKGGMYEAEIINIEQKKVSFQIIEKYTNYNKRRYNLHIAIAPTKRIDRFEWFLEKATEIGVDEISPIICSNSERKIIKIDRLQKILISSAKQSLNAYLPKINKPLDFNSFISKINDQKFIAHCKPGEKCTIDMVYNKNKDTLILIGPEGDFTSNEIQTAIENGFKEITIVRVD